MCFASQHSYSLCLLTANAKGYNTLNNPALTRYVNQLQKGKNMNLKLIYKFRKRTVKRVEELFMCSSASLFSLLDIITRRFTLQDPILRRRMQRKIEVILKSSENSGKEDRGIIHVLLCFISLLLDILTLIFTL